MKNPNSERKTIKLITDGTAADKIVVMSVEQLGDFPYNVEIVPYSCTWEQVPSANVITGGTLNISMGSMKRKFEELMSVNLLVPSDSNLGGRPPLAFYDSELPGGAANLAIPLLVQHYSSSTSRHRGLMRHNVHQPLGTETSKLLKDVCFRQINSRARFPNPVNLLRTKGKLMRASRMQTW